MTGHRSEMIAGMLRDLLSSLLLEEARDPRLSLVTITEVEVSRDLSHARVFVSKLGTDAEREAAVKALNHASPYFRREIARRTRLRRAPELAFVEDAALQGGFRITRLLDEIRSERPEAEPPTSPPGRSVVTGSAEGLLLVDKPPGPTSHDVVTRVRRLVRADRAGHTGTLDPAATGLLVVLLGRATRLARFVPREPKAYTGAIRLGIRTRTDDLHGDPLFVFDGPAPPPDEVHAAASALVGRHWQAPPVVSARKLGGERLYRLARMGRPAVAPPSEVVVTRLALAPSDDPFTWTFEAEVSAGTYVRALARDLGEALGCGGTLALLRRTGIGTLRVDEAVPLREDQALASRLRAAVVSLDDIPLCLPAARIGETDARTFRQGGSVVAPASAPAEGDCAVFGPAGNLLGVGISGQSRIRPSVVLPLPGSPGPD